MSKPTYKEIEATRRSIFRQIREDQTAPLGTPYRHGDLFHEAIQKAYNRGLADGRAEYAPGHEESKKAAIARRRQDGGHFG